MLISLTFVVCAHSQTHRANKVDTTRLLPDMTATELREAFSSYEVGHKWYLSKYDTARLYQVSDVYQETQMQR